MDAKQLFFERYQGFQEYPEMVLKDMTEQQVRQSPHPALNPIIWLLWHTARCEDMAVNRLITAGVQVLDTDSWLDRLGMAERSMGTGITREEVGVLSSGLNLSSLVGYRTAITQNTEHTIAEMNSDELGRQLSDDDLQRVLVQEGNGGRVAESIVQAYSGRTKGWLLGHLALTHNYYHIGQAFSIRALYGAANPW